MTADDSVQQAPDHAEGAAAAEARGEKCRQDSRRIANWSVAWLLVALVMWGLFAFLMFADYGPEVGTPTEPRSLCQGPLLNPSPESSICRSDDLRQWPALLGILALAVIPSVAAAATAVYAKVLSRMARA